MTLTLASVYVADTDDLKDESRFLRLYLSMPEYRRRKIDAMRFDKDKRLSLGVGLLLSRALRDWGIDCPEPEIGYSIHQKPFLTQFPNLHFNLSHSEERVMCAISDCEIGCDVELVTPIDLNIAKKFFFASEFESIANHPDGTSRYDIFFRFWTLKESFMKVTGLGFYLNLSDFCVEFQNDNIVVCQSVDDADYTFREYSLENDYKYAICVRTRHLNDKVIKCRFQEWD